jgi:cell wall assembly regulator SMI1
MKVRESWLAIEAFLEREFPLLRASLAPGATKEEIQATEKTLGVKLPSELKESLQIHNGQNDPQGLLGAFDVRKLFCCSEIVKAFELAMEIYNDTGPPHPSERPATKRIKTDLGWSPGWVPFAGFQNSLVVVDCLPPEPGVFGQVFATDFQCPDDISHESYSEWLASYADAFGKGRFNIEAGIPVVDGYDGNI